MEKPGTVFAGRDAGEKDSLEQQQPGGFLSRQVFPSRVCFPAGLSVLTWIDSRSGESDRIPCVNVDWSPRGACKSVPGGDFLLLDQTREESMLPGTLIGASEWALFTRIDASVAEDFRQAGCGCCGGRLHVADDARKPRGLGFRRRGLHAVQLLLRFGGLPAAVDAALGALFRLTGFRLRMLSGGFGAFLRLQRGGGG